MRLGLFPKREDGSMSGELIALPLGAAWWTLTSTGSITLKVEVGSHWAWPKPRIHGHGGAPPHGPDQPWTIDHPSGLGINNGYVPPGSNDQTKSESHSQGQGVDILDWSATGIHVPFLINYVQTIYMLVLGIIVPAAVGGKPSIIGQSAQNAPSQCSGVGLAPGTADHVPRPGQHQAGINTAGEAGTQSSRPDSGPRTPDDQG